MLVLSLVQLLYVGLGPKVCSSLMIPYKPIFILGMDDTRTYCIHLTIFSNQCCGLFIQMQEIFPKEKGN